MGAYLRHRPRVHPSRGAARPLLAPVLVAVLLQGCITENVTQVVITAVTVRPDTATIVEGGTLAFEALVTDDADGLTVNNSVAWSSGAPHIVSVDEGGVALALSNGVTTIEASYRGVTGSATVTVVPGPSVLLDPPAVTVSADVLGDRPAPASVDIRNGGEGRLTGLAAAVRYESGESGWLTAELSGDTTPATLTLTPATDRLPAGDYHAVVVVTSAETGDRSTSLPVHLSLVGISVQETEGSTSVFESGATDTVSVQLDTDPGASVVLSVTSDDPEQLDASPPLLTFTASNWFTPQPVILTAVDDLVVNGDRIVQVTVSVADAGGTPYAVARDRVVEVTVVDDDVAGIWVTETAGGTSALAGGHTDTIVVVLTAEPMSNVVLSVWTDDPDHAAVDRSRLTFTPLDWDDPQNVIFMALDNEGRDGFGFTTVTVAVDPAASDPAFHGLSRTIDAVTIDSRQSPSPTPGPET